MAKLRAVMARSSSAVPAIWLSAATSTQPAKAEVRVGASNCGNASSNASHSASSGMP